MSDNTAIALKSKPTSSAGDLVVIPAPEVEAALTAILDSKLFSKAQRMSGLLRFLVGKLLTGAIRDINEYTIGIEVFDRDASTFTPSEDPIVRVQVGRLRDRLKEYYAAGGSNAEIRFDIPIGTHVPTVRRVPQITLDRPRHNVLALRPIQCITAASESSYFSQGLNEELVHQLFQTLGEQLTSPVPLPYDGVNDADARKLARGHGASHMLEGSVRVEGALIRASLRLVDLHEGQIAWAGQFDRHFFCAIALQEELAITVCDALKPYF